MQVKSRLTRTSVYQEYLAKTLTDKYNHLNIQMDRMVNEANSELEILHQRLNSMPRLNLARQYAD